jgi:Bacterial Ig-like domain (group 3)
MKRNLRAVIASAGTLAITGGVLAATVLPAAASYPGTPWEPASASPALGQADTAHQIGTLALFNASGTQVTSGTNLNHLFDYALASTADPGSGTIANLEFAGPQPSTAPDAWPTTADESSPTPNTGSSTPSNLRNTSTPVVTLDSAGANLAAAKGSFATQTATGYANVYEVRIYTTDASKYWAADVKIVGTSWVEQYGSPVTSTNALAASPNPAASGATVTLTDTITNADGTTPAAGGTVDFFDGATKLNSSAVTISGNTATFTTSSLSQGAHASLHAVYTPNNTSTTVDYTGSTSPNTSETINAPATNTTVSLTLGGGYQTVNQSSTFSGTVAPANTPGSVAFYLDGSTTALSGTTGSYTQSSGSYSYTYAAGFGAGSHTLVVKFTPTDTTAFNPSQNSASFATNFASGTPCTQSPQTGCTDTQTITGTIPPGTLSISTPYTATNPLNVGTLALSADGTYWTKTATFKCITVTDATSGGSPFVASALANTLSLVSGTSVGTQNQSSAFTTINSENVGLTGLAASPNTTAYCPDGTTPVNSYTKATTPTANPAATGVAPGDTGASGLGGSTPHTVLTGTSGGEGTATFDGTLTLNAPTSTKDGQYKGTIVFTVTD